MIIHSQFAKYLQEQQSPQQQPPPYHIAKAFTKKTKQDLLIYDIYRNNYQHQPVNKSMDQQLHQNDRQDNSLSTQEPSETNSTTSNSFNVVDSDNNEINTNDINASENHSRNNSLLQSRNKWLFGEHKNPTVVSVLINQIHFYLFAKNFDKYSLIFSFCSYRCN